MDGSVGARAVSERPRPLAPPVGRSVRLKAVLVIAVAGALLVAAACDSLNGTSLVVAPNLGDASLLVVIFGLAWLLRGLRAVVLRSHEWPWHLLRISAALAVVGAELLFYAGNVRYRPDPALHTIALIALGVFVAVTLGLLARRIWLRAVAKGRVGGWALRKSDHAQHLPWLIPSNAGEPFVVLVGKGSALGDAYRRPLAELDIARVPLRALRPVLEQLGDITR